MTKEEAIKELENMRKFNYTLAPMEVFDMAIEALSAIEDIKAEIEEEWQADMYEDKFGVADCLNIIDKHISGKESE